MEIRIIKGQGSDRIEGRRMDGSSFSSTLPHKGPVPHDLVHFVVEGELGFDRGFWGMVAVGNDPEQIADIAKAAGHASAKRAGTPRESIVQAIQAERIVESFEAELWSSGSSNDAVRDMARAGCEQSLVQLPALDDNSMDRIRRELAALSGIWEGLAIGEALTLEWPERKQAAA